MRKLVVLGMGVCLMLAFASCKSSESAYKKAYEKAKQQELAEPQVEAPVEVTPVVAPPVVTAPVTEAPKVADTSGIREEKVTVVSGNDGLKDYSVVAGSFGVKANADGLKEWLDAQGYQATIAFNAEKAMYRVIVSSLQIRRPLPMRVTLSRLNIRTVRISRAHGCSIAYIDFFLVIYYMGKNKRFFRIRRR